MSCKCQGCGNRYKVDLLIPDNLWEKIKPEGQPKGSGLLCGHCIVNRLENMGYGAFTLECVSYGPNGEVVAQY